MTASSRMARWEWAALAALAAIALAVLFNGAYFPFSRDDALGIYRPAALDMWAIGGLQPLTGADSLYRAYPPLVPLLYTFAYQISGWENEYLAKALGTLLGLMCLPAVYLLARQLADRRAGILAALLLAITPAFTRWASAGYVDVPMAAFYTVGALYTVRFWESGRGRDALLAGVMVGLAALTKNAGLIGVGLFGMALIARAASDRRMLPAALIGLIAVTLIAAPWYIRNLIGAGFLIPDTAWTDQAERTLSSLLIYISLPDNFAITGWVIVAAIVWLARRVVRWRAGPIDAARAGLILGFTLPFFAAWWLFVSYDPRFVMLFTPILCAAGGAWLVRMADAGSVPRIVWRAAAALSIALVAFNLWIAVEYKDEILRDPFMTHAEKIALVRGE